MKKVTSCIIMLVVLGVLAMAGSAQAGDRAGAFSLSPFIGGIHYDDDQPLVRNRILYGLRLGYDFTDYFGAEAVGYYINAEYKRTDSHLAHWSYRMDFLYNILPHAVFVPYLAAGAGGQRINYYDRDGGDSNDVNWNLGGGFKVFMTEDFALRADARHIWDYAKDTYRNWEYSLGLTWLFGGKKAAVTAMTPYAEPYPTGAATGGEVTPAAEPTPGHYKYCVTLNVEFDIDKAIIRQEYRDEVAKVGDFMKKYPTTTAVIEGHTDNVGTEQYNMELSQRRAQAVVDYLVEEFGIDRSRLTARGYGFSRPVADNATNEGRQKNRRIEAIIDCAFDVKLVEPPERLCMTLVMDFDTGSAQIKPEYRGEIAKVADYMKQYPTTTALIEGHTDNVGDPTTNMQLSQQRAENVMNYLVENFGIERSRLSAKGYGETRRIAYNDTEEGRQKNRRINAIIDCVITR